MTVMVSAYFSLQWIDGSLHMYANSGCLFWNCLTHTVHLHAAGYLGLTSPWNHKPGHWPLTSDYRLKFIFPMQTLRGMQMSISQEVESYIYLVEVIHGVHEDVYSYKATSDHVFRVIEDTDGIWSSGLRGGTFCHQWKMDYLFDIYACIHKFTVHVSKMRSIWTVKVSVKRNVLHSK